MARKFRNRKKVMKTVKIGGIMFTAIILFLSYVIYRIFFGQYLS